MADATATPIPRYYLYGDQGPDVELDFLHIEPIPDRSGPNDWTIRPHAHPDHMQVLMLSEGGGEVRLEDRTLSIPAPGLMVIPAGTVHEIHFLPGSDGYVVTAALAYFRAAAADDPRLAEAAMLADVYPIEGSGVSPTAFADTFYWLHREFVWSAPARRTSIKAHFMRVLVLVLRLHLAHAQAGVGTRDRDYDLMVRYRALLEAHFRTERSLGFYAGALAVTPPRLNAACKARAGRTASELLYERILIEAKRYLVYTDLSVAEVGHRAGFDDPAYFNRFFSQRVGQSPRAYRLATTPLDR